MNRRSLFATASSASFALAAAAAAAGAAQIATILSTARREPSQPPRKPRPVNLTLSGGRYSRDEVDALLRAISDGLGTSR